MPVSYATMLVRGRSWPGQGGRGSPADLEGKVDRVSCLPGFYLLTLEASNLKSIFFAQTLELWCPYLEGGSEGRVNRSLFPTEPLGESEEETWHMMGSAAVGAMDPSVSPLPHCTVLGHSVALVPHMGNEGPGPDDRHGTNQL